MAMTTYPPERNASARRYVVIGAGTHMLLLESNRAQLHREVQLFLDEGLPDS